MTPDSKTIITAVQQLFSYPEGQLVLDWLEELHCFHKFQAVVQSASPNAPLAMAYMAGKADLVKELQYMATVGLPEDVPQPEAGGIEYGNWG